MITFWLFQQQTVSYFLTLFQNSKPMPLILEHRGKRGTLAKVLLIEPVEQNNEAAPILQ